MSRTLVVGCGFIGAHVAADLAEKGERPIVLTRSPPSSETSTRLHAAEVVIGDASDPEAVRALLDGVDSVVYCAGGLMPAASNRQPALDSLLTLQPLLGVLNALGTQPGVRLVYLSSGGTVYGQPTCLPVDESHATEPISVYGIMKLTGEKCIGMYSHLSGVTATTLRCSNVYGEHQPLDREQGVIPLFLDALAHDQPIAIYGDGSAVRDFVYVGDVVSVISKLLAEEELPEVINVGSGEGTSLNELIDTLEQVCGSRAQVDRRPSRPFDVDRIVLDIARLRSRIAFDPISLRDGVERCWRAIAPTRPPGS